MPSLPRLGIMRKLGALARRSITFTRQINSSRNFKQLVSLAEALGKLVIIITVANWLVEIPDRKALKDAAAWTVVNTASKNSADGGRSAQLALLNNDDVSLAGIDISKAHLSNLRLIGADLTKANFDSSHISKVLIFPVTSYFFGR